VLLSEPPPSPADVNFSLFGIPVRVHPWFWIITILLGVRSETLVSLLAWVVAVFVAIVIHELGHALTARRYGFSPWITLHGMGGLTSYNPTGAYGTRGYSALAQVSITVAGPVAGFLLAAVVVAILRLTNHPIEIDRMLRFIPLPHTPGVGSLLFTLFINDLLQISVLWGVINLLPIYPLDGGQIAREVLLKVNRRDGIRLSLMLSMITATAMGVLIVVQWRSDGLFSAVFFGYLAYMNYLALQSYLGRGPF
jgi:Zn-dependent protease